MIFFWITINFLIHVLLLYAILKVYRSNKNLAILTLISYFTIVFAYLPYANWVPGGELKRAYLDLISKGLIPGYNMAPEAEPFLFIHWITLKSFYDYFMTDAQASLLLRIFSFWAILYISYRIISVIQSKYDLSPGYVLWSIVLVGLDWHFGLLICDEYRNLFGLVFYLYVVYYLIKNDWNFSFKALGLSSVIAILVHKSFILLMPILFLISKFRNLLYRYLKIEYIILIALPGLIGGKELLNILASLTQIMSLDKINHNLINTGLDEIMHPGMMAQALISFGILWIIFYNRNRINSDKFLYPLALIAVLLSELFFLPLFGIQFVEYERIFFSFSPLVIPFLVFLIFKTFTKISAFLLLLLYSIYDLMIHSTFIDLLGFYTYGYTNNFEAIFSPTLFIVIILFCLIGLITLLVKLKTLFQIYSLFILFNYLAFVIFFNSSNNNNLFLELLFFCTTLSILIYPLRRLKIGR